MVIKMTKGNDELTFKISYINRILKRNIDQDTLKYGLTVEQGRAIVYLYNHRTEDIHLTDLENVFHLRKSSLTSLINNLEKNGYVVRTIQKNDQRLKKLELTVQGEEKVKLLFKSFHESEENIRRSLTKDEANQLNKLFDKIISSINNQ